MLDENQRTSWLPLTSFSSLSKALSYGSMESHLKVWPYKWFLSQLTLFSTNSFTHLTSDLVLCSVADEVIPNNYSTSTVSILGGFIDAEVTRKVLTSWVVTTILCYQPWIWHVWSTLVLLRPERKVMQIQALKAVTESAGSLPNQRDRENRSEIAVDQSFSTLCEHMLLWLV